MVDAEDMMRQDIFERTKVVCVDNEQGLAGGGRGETGWQGSRIRTTKKREIKLQSATGLEEKVYSM